MLTGMGRMDFGQIEGLMGLATTALGMTGKAAETAQTIKGLLSSGKAPDNSEAAKLLNDLATQLTAANMTNLQLSEALRSVVRELREQDQFESEKARYELISTPYGDMVYRLKQSMANGEPVHYICPACLKKDRLVIFIQGDGDYKICQINSAHVYTFNRTDYRRTDDNGPDFY